ncbi:MAG: hypothetical protein K2K67_04050 [Treponemataceae bacterium]|nr:hypothetical protein [Treponemataceae bacterium]
MDFVGGNLKRIYVNFLLASFGSTLISMIYGIVDMAMVGWYEGPDATAALACFSPVWNVVYAIGLLTGIGGAVLFSNAVGKCEKEKANGFFTLALMLTAVIIGAFWLLMIFFDAPILRLFGADDNLLPYAQKYLFPLKFCLPMFTFNNLLSCFIRNDGRPRLATAAVLAGGIFNVFGDWFFVFALDMGVMGAGIATGIGAFITLFVLLSHFFSKKNTLRLNKRFSFAKDSLRILSTGFSSFFIDIAMGIFTVLANNQIMKYLGTPELSIYAVIIQLFTFVQCCAYSVGQAAQPIMSVNFGAGKGDRVKRCLKYGFISALLFGVFWTALSLGIPTAFVRIFMQPTDEIISKAPLAIRIYATSFILLSLNVASTYYFQSVLKRLDSFVVSILRGILVNGVLIFALPALFGGTAIWFVMPLTELLTFAYVLARIAFAAQPARRPAIF